MNYIITLSDAQDAALQQYVTQVNLEPGITATPISVLTQLATKPFDLRIQQTRKDAADVRAMKYEALSTVDQVAVDAILTKVGGK